MSSSCWCTGLNLLDKLSHHVKVDFIEGDQLVYEEPARVFCFLNLISQLEIQDYRYQSDKLLILPRKDCNLATLFTMPSDTAWNENAVLLGNARFIT